jgi:hypothetical protein
MTDSGKLTVDIVQQGIWDMPLESMPLAAGYLKATAIADDVLALKFDIDIRNFRGGTTLSAMAYQLFGERVPDVLAFSVFGWSFRAFGALAATFKQLNPRGWVIFGGTHVANQADRVFAMFPEVDVVVNGEGEFVFRDLLHAYLDGADPDSLAGITGISYRDDEHAAVRLHRAAAGAQHPDGVLVVQHVQDPFDHVAVRDRQVHVEVAVDDVPPARDVRFVEPVPQQHRVAVEQHPPQVGALPQQGEQETAEPAADVDHRAGGREVVSPRHDGVLHVGDLLDPVEEQLLQLRVPLEVPVDGRAEHVVDRVGPLGEDGRDPVRGLPEHLVGEHEDPGPRRRPRVRAERGAPGRLGEPALLVPVEDTPAGQQDEHPVEAGGLGAGGLGQFGHRARPVDHVVRDPDLRDDTQGGRVGERHRFLVQPQRGLMIVAHRLPPWCGTIMLYLS